MHNALDVPEGQFMAVSGFVMAIGNTCIITSRGMGGHGAIPQLAVDPVVAGASMVMAEQTIASVDLARALAQRLGVELEFIVFDFLSGI